MHIYSIIMLIAKKNNKYMAFLKKSVYYTKCYTYYYGSAMCY